MTPDTVFIAYMASDMMHSKTAECLAGLALSSPPGEPIIAISRTKTVRQWVGRNSAIRGFLAGPAEWFMWIDSDMVFTHQDFYKLWDARHEAKMLSGLCFMWSPTTGEMAPNGFVMVDGDYAPIELPAAGSRVWVDAVGTAFMLIHRSVFENMEDPWHEEFTQHPDTGRVMGHDLAFCHKAGGRVLYCTDVSIGHLKVFNADERVFRSGQLVTQ